MILERYERSRTQKFGSPEKEISPELRLKIEGLRESSTQEIGENIGAIEQAIRSNDFLLSLDVDAILWGMMCHKDAQIRRKADELYGENQHVLSNNLRILNCLPADRLESQFDLIQQAYSKKSSHTCIGIFEILAKINLKGQDPEKKRQAVDFLSNLDSGISTGHAEILKKIVLSSREEYSKKKALDAILTLLKCIASSTHRMHNPFQRLVEDLIERDAWTRQMLARGLQEENTSKNCSSIIFGTYRNLQRRERDEKTAIEAGNFTKTDEERKKKDQPRRKWVKKTVKENYSLILGQLDGLNLYDDPEWMELLYETISEKELEKECVEGVVLKLNSFGLEGKQVFEDWKKSYSDAWEEKTDEQGRKHSRENDFWTLLKNNFENIIELEQKNPGAAKALHDEFDISNFGRYDKRTLSTQFELRDEKDVPYGAVIFPKGDYNGAFYNDRYMIEDLRKQLENLGIALRVTECKSAIRVFGNLQKMQKRYNKSGENPIQFLVVGGHGSPYAVDFGVESPQGTRKISTFLLSAAHFLDKDKLPANLSADLQRILKTIEEARTFFSKNMPIVLVACQAGADSRSGIVKRTSEVFGAAVVGSEEILGSGTTQIRARLEGDQLCLDTNFPKKRKFEKGLEVQ